MASGKKKRKSRITIAETPIHIFDLEVEGDADPYEEAEEAFGHAEKLSYLDNHSEIYGNSGIENAIPT